MKHALRQISSAVMACLVSAMLPTPAHAGDANDDVTNVLQAAINGVDAVPATPNDRVDLPLEADEPALFELSDGGGYGYLTVAAAGCIENNL